MATTDYYNTCADQSSNVKPPEIFTGYQFPFHGSAFAGIIVYEDFWPEIAEYIQCQLLEPLKPCYKYRVSFYVNLCDHCMYASNQIGAKFTVDKLQQVSPYDVYWFNMEADVISKDYITDTLNWIKIEGEYIASGGEEWLTIGRFFKMPIHHDIPVTDYLDLMEVVPDTNGFPNYPGQHAYYYIDSVQVYEIGIAEEFPILTTNVFSPNGDGINDYWSLEIPEMLEWNCVIYNRWGNEIALLNAMNNSWDGTFNGTAVPAGTYYYGISYENCSGEIKTKKGFVQVFR